MLVLCSLAHSSIWGSIYKPSAFQFLAAGVLVLCILFLAMTQASSCQDIYGQTFLLIPLIFLQFVPALTADSPVFRSCSE